MSVRQRIKRGMRHQQAIDAYEDRHMRNMPLVGDNFHDDFTKDMRWGKPMEKVMRNFERGHNREIERLEERYGQ